MIGTLGAALIIGAYFFLQLEKISSRSILYSSLNALGAAMILFSLFYEFNTSAFVVEFFWLLVSFLGLAKGLSRR